MNWIFVGASTIAAQYMLSAVRSQAGHKVSWVVSGSMDRGAAWARDHGVPSVTTDLAEALADSDATIAYISTTNEKHFGQAMACIAAGKHVLCEKPLAITLGEACRMVAAARDAGVVFGTNHHLRCSGAHRAIKEVIAKGQIGKVLSLRIHHAVYLPENLQGWRINDAAAGGGVVPDITVHNADVARFLLNEDPQSVVAQVTSSGMGEGVEDSAMSVWMMPSGTMVMSHESFTHEFAGNGLEVHGESGSIFANNVMTQEPIGTVELVTGSGRQQIPFPQHSLYERGVSDFVTAVEGQGRAAADGVDGVKSLAVALAVREAAQSGKRITVNYGEVS
ncbi:Gfo/Idh/MocA family protein [Roseobacter sp. EG26]|uniref:Gfo/Idh/MocA family protein n=1 Tax=Roseobacter sp. EG26 TaxID=3412477 RepID=UPI003CE54E96